MTGVLQGSVALVTGAAGGIGNATVEAMIAAGAEVVATDLNAPQSGTLNVAHDVTNPVDWAAVAALVEARWGRLDCLVNNAGIAAICSIEENTLADWRRIMAVNVESMLLSLQAMLPMLKASGSTRDGGASVVNMSSTAANIGAPFVTAYSASKGAVRALTKSAACEFGGLGYNIRVNSMHPGATGTGMTDQMIGEYVRLGIAPDVATARAGVSDRYPLKRWGRPEEIANGIVFLSSSAASYMTGSEMVIDGGFIAQ